MTWNYYTVLPKGICCINEYEKEQHISTLEIFIHQQTNIKHKPNTTKVIP